MFYTLVLNSINNYIYITRPHISANEHILHIILYINHISMYKT